jgi:hypothetical protein
LALDTSMSNPILDLDATPTTFILGMNASRPYPTLGLDSTAST